MPTVFMENSHYVHLLHKTKGFIFLQNYYQSVKTCDLNLSAVMFYLFMVYDYF